VGDSPSARVVRADLDGDAIARENLDVVLAHSAADRGEDAEAVVRLDAEHGVRERLLNDAVELELVALRFARPAVFRSPSPHAVPLLLMPSAPKRRAVTSSGLPTPSMRRSRPFAS